MTRFLVKVFIVASAMLLSRAKETTSKVWIISIVHYNPDIRHCPDTLSCLTESAFNCTKTPKLSFTYETGAFRFQDFILEKR